MLIQQLNKISGRAIPLRVALRPSRQGVVLASSAIVNSRKEEQRLRADRVHMRYYFHILKGRERLRDPDGEEFPSLAAARVEATQCARDLIAEELRCGRAVPSQWSIQIAHANETIADTVPFAPLLMSETIQALGRHRRITREDHRELIVRAIATSDRARTSHAEIARHLINLRDNLRTLAELNRAFTRYQATK